MAWSADGYIVPVAVLLTSHTLKQARVSWHACIHTSSKSASSGLSCETHFRKVLLPALMLPSTQSVTRFDLPVVLGPPASAISSSTLCLMSVTMSLQWWLRIPTVSCSDWDPVPCRLCTWVVKGLSLIVIANVSRQLGTSLRREMQAARYSLFYCRV